MPKYSRSIRVGEQIRRILALTITREISDPVLRLISVVAVKLSPDLSIARIYVTSLNDVKDRKQMIDLLNDSTKLLRNHLSKQLSIRRIPNLYFVYDESIEYANKIESLIDDALIDKS